MYFRARKENMFNIIGADGNKYGPVAAEQIRQWIREGRANGATQAQPQQGGDWKPLAAMPDFADVLNQSSAPPRMTPPVGNASSRASNKLAAGLCGILLGGLGVHKFILGYNSAGTVMLAVSLGGIFAGLFTCGITFVAAWAMGLIGLVEGIIYLTKSDEEFVRIYVDGRKEWF
ncbi:MAG: hypothetical protein RLY20_1975 [Verrucomicrobiota bacterium]|jgi:TM2 domain-containing membrane protein YozV